MELHTLPREIFQIHGLKNLKEQLGSAIMYFIDFHSIGLHYNNLLRGLGRDYLALYFCIFIEIGVVNE